MKKIYFLSRVLTLLFFISIYSQANQSQFLLAQDAVIDQRAISKIDEIGSEVKSKLGVNIYIYAKTKYSETKVTSMEEKIKIIKDTEGQILNKLEGSYVLLTLALDLTHVNIITSNDIKDKIDKNDILNGYIVPLLASKDKNTLFAKASAALLNGYAQIADSLAEQKGIKLNSSIGSGGKTTGTIWKMFMYTLVFGGIILYTIAILRQKKLK